MPYTGMRSPYTEGLAFLHGKTGFVARRDANHFVLPLSLRKTGAAFVTEAAVFVADGAEDSESDAAAAATAFVVTATAVAVAELVAAFVGMAAATSGTTPTAATPGPEEDSRDFFALASKPSAIDVTAPMSANNANEAPSQSTQFGCGRA